MARTSGCRWSALSLATLQAPVFVPIVDSSLKVLLSMVNRLPRGSAISLNDNKHSWCSSLQPLVVRLRRLCFPRASFEHCAVFRGCLNASGGLLRLDDNGYAVLWRKNDRQPRVMVVPVAQLRVDGADLAPWSVVVFWNEADTSPVVSGDDPMAEPEVPPVDPPAPAGAPPAPPVPPAPPYVPQLTAPIYHDPDLPMDDQMHSPSGTPPVSPEEPPMDQLMMAPPSPPDEPPPGGGVLVPIQPSPPDEPPSGGGALVPVNAKNICFRRSFIPRLRGCPRDLRNVRGRRPPFLLILW